MFSNNSLQPDNTTIVLDVNGKLSVAYNPNVNVVDIVSSPTDLVGNSLNTNNFSNVTGNNPQGVTFNNTSGNLTIKRGVKFTVNSSYDVLLSKVTFSTGTTATKAYLYADDHVTEIAKVSITAKVATFANNVLTKGTTYYIFCDSEGSIFNGDYYQTMTSYPVVCGDLTYIASSDVPSDYTNLAFVVVSIDVISLALNLTLPTTCVVGSIIKIVGSKKSTIQINQNANQQIFSGASAQTTLGVTGKLVISTLCSSLELVCVTANNTFIVVNSNGTLTLS